MRTKNKIKLLCIHYFYVLKDFLDVYTTSLCFAVHQAQADQQKLIISFQQSTVKSRRQGQHNGPRYFKQIEHTPMDTHNQSNFTTPQSTLYICSESGLS